MSCFLHDTSLPSPSPLFPNLDPDSLLHPYPNHGDFSSFANLERDYMGLGGGAIFDDNDDQNSIAARESKPPLFFNTSVLHAGADLCGSHLKLAPPGSCEDDDGSLDDSETLSGNIGWPPVSSYRKTSTRSLSIKPSCNVELPTTMIVPIALTNGAIKHESFDGNRTGGVKLPSMKKPMPIHQIPKASWIKVSMDGTPIMRKLNLKSIQGYDHLFMELHQLFKFNNSSLSCDVGNASYSNDRNGFDYVLTYEDRERDWMLLGDTPWQTFTQSARRIRMMKKFK